MKLPTRYEMNARPISTARVQPSLKFVTTYSLIYSHILIINIFVISHFFSINCQKEAHIIENFHQHDWSLEPRHRAAQLHYSHNNNNNNIQLIKSLSNIERSHKHNLDNSIHKMLPNGPPPFRPSTLLLGLSTTSILDKLKRTRIFKKIYKSKVYYLFLDVLQQLIVLVDKIAKKKIDLTDANMAAIHAVINKFALKGGHKLKLKWPLVMLNPHFIKEILSNPTYLVMLFHAIEVAYMSMPVNFWLKPLVKLVKQPSYEKEEEIWWRRKRIYDTLNGHGASELQPNLKTIHFKNRGQHTPVAFPRIVNRIRQLTGRPAPDSHHYKYPDDNIYPSDINLYTDQSAIIHYPVEHLSHNLVHPPDGGKYNNEVDMNDAFLAKQIPQPGHASQQSPTVPTNDWTPAIESNINLQKEPSEIQTDPLIGALSIDQDHWLSRLPTQDQLMSQSEFDSLDAHERDLVLREAQKRIEESRLTNELIKQQNDIIESFVHRQDDLMVRPDFINNDRTSYW